VLSVLMLVQDRFRSSWAAATTSLARAKPLRVERELELELSAGKGEERLKMSCKSKKSGVVLFSGGCIAIIELKRCERREEKGPSGSRRALSCVALPHKANISDHEALQDQPC